MKKLKSLNRKVLSTLPIIGMCLVTNQQISNAMLENILNRSSVRTLASFFSSPSGESSNLSVKYTVNKNGGRSVSILNTQKTTIFYGSNGRRSPIFPQASQQQNTTKINIPSTNTTSPIFYGTQVQRPIFQQAKEIPTISTTSTSSTNTNNKNQTTLEQQISSNIVNKVYLRLLEQEVKFWGALSNAVNK